MSFYEGMDKWIDEGGEVDIVYLDFSKSFDIISHNKRLGNDMKLGIMGDKLEGCDAVQ